MTSSVFAMRPCSNGSSDMPIASAAAAPAPRSRAARSGWLWAAATAARPSRAYATFSVYSSSRPRGRSGSASRSAHRSDVCSGMGRSTCRRARRFRRARRRGGPRAQAQGEKTILSGASSSSPCSFSPWAGRSCAPRRGCAEGERRGRPASGHPLSVGGPPTPRCRGACFRLRFRRCLPDRRGAE